MRILWCEAHEQSGQSWCDIGWRQSGGHRCRMVSMRLIPDNAETVNLEKLAAALKKPWPVHWEKSSIIAAAQAWLALDGETP